MDWIGLRNTAGVVPTRWLPSSTAAPGGVELSFTTRMDLSSLIMSGLFDGLPIQCFNCRPGMSSAMRTSLSFSSESSAGVFLPVSASLTRILAPGGVVSTFIATALAGGGAGLGAGAGLTSGPGPGPGFTAGPGPGSVTGGMSFFGSPSGLLPPNLI